MEKSEFPPRVRMTWKPGGRPQVATQPRMDAENHEYLSSVEHNHLLQATADKALEYATKYSETVDKLLAARKEAEEARAKAFEEAALGTCPTCKKQQDLIPPTPSRFIFRDERDWPEAKAYTRQKAAQIEPSRWQTHADEYVPASRLTELEKERIEWEGCSSRLFSERNAAEAREQRLLTAWEGLMGKLNETRDHCEEHGWEEEAKCYQYAAEWAQAALEKGRGDEKTNTE